MAAASSAAPRARTQKPAGPVSSGPSTHVRMAAMAAPPPTPPSSSSSSSSSSTRVGTAERAASSAESPTSSSVSAGWAAVAHMAGPASSTPAK